MRLSPEQRRLLLAIYAKPEQTCSYNDHRIRFEWSTWEALANRGLLRQGREFTDFTMTDEGRAAAKVLSDKQPHEEGG